MYLKRTRHANQGKGHAIEFDLAPEQPLGYEHFSNEAQLAYI